MCGIIGYLGEDSSFDYILNGLYKLQNRGYDSAGILSIKDSNFLIDKIVLDNTTNNGLDEFNKYKEKYKNCNLGIGHTRWATHGPICIKNTHPHINNDNNIAIVHNGVIDNYLLLKELLKDYSFYSDTDSEIICNLLDYNKCENNMETIQKTIQMLEGTFSLIISFLDEPETLYITKNGSPLLLSYTDKIALISSEESGFNGITKNYIRLNNYDIYKITYTDEISITNDTDKKKELIENKDYQNKSDNSYKPFNNWTEKEIYKQDISLYNCINNGGRIKNDEEVMLGGLELYKEALKKIDNLIILGCGSSHYSSLLGKYYFKDLTNLNLVLPINACEFEIEDIPKLGKTALLFLTQSGETMDLYKILEKVKDLDILTIGLVNTVNSTIANETDCGVYLNIGKEHGVASTKSFTSQCLILCIISIFFSQIHNINSNIRKNYIEDIKSINYDVNLLFKNINEKCKKVSETLSKYDNIFVIGKNQSEAIALEGALKIKEITYIHCEGYSASMLKHGPFSLLSENTPVIIIIPDSIFYDKTYSVLEQIKSRGSPVFLISNKVINGVNEENTIIMPKKNKLYSILNIIPLQIIAYYISILRNINPDFPRNLAKVVTVE